MSQTVETEVRDPLLQKVIAQINEEKLVKDINLVQLSKLKTFDEIAAELSGENASAEALQLLDENLKESATSLVSRYLLGLVALKKDGVDSEGRLRSLLDHYTKNAKWTIVDHIADCILENDDKNRAALRAKVDATERLKGKKELRPYLEKLAQIDRKNPDIVKKYALSILDEDAPKAISALKQAGESYARVKDYRNLEEIWNLIVQHDHKDLGYFERLERILVGNREKTRAAAYLVNLVEPHRAEENWPAVISILKKILEYQPDSTRARGDLVRAYRALYETHSLLNEFLKMSDLTNHKKPVGPCIASFERNIVFDKGNYVHHRTRGVGKIAEIDKDQVIVDFRDNPGQRMSIQMAITSLQPITSDHFWVRMYENPDEMKEIFQTDLPLFFETLLSSFGKRMTLAEIKSELTPRFVAAADWSKWWTKARTVIKDHPRFGFNLKKKDEVVLRETEVSPSEELSMRFQGASDWNQKLDLALEALKSEQTEDAAQTCIQFYRENEGARDAVKQLHSFLYLELAQTAMGEEITDRKLKREQAKEIVQKAKAKDLIKWVAETTGVDMKREMVNIIARSRPDSAEILGEILFEVPIKVNGHVLNELNRSNQEATLKTFLHRTLTRYREHPETFLWAAKGILGGKWNYPWIDVSREDVFLMIFRLLKPLNQIEKKGTRLKNTAIETIFGTTNITVEALKKNDMLGEIIAGATPDRLRRMAALFREVPYAADAHKENFLQYLEEMRPDFIAPGAETEEEDETEEGIEALLPPEGVILVSADALTKRKEHLNNLINVDMPANSRDIGEAMEKGDLRENAEYKAALEKQSTLQAEIQQLSEEVKRAQIIQPRQVQTDRVRIGVRVDLRTANGDQVSYRILGPWDADAEQNVISYASPLAQALLGKVAGDEASLDGGQRFTIEKIASAFG